MVTTGWEVDGKAAPRLNSRCAESALTAKYCEILRTLQAKLQPCTGIANLNAQADFGYLNHGRLLLRNIVDIASGCRNQQSSHGGVSGEGKNGLDSRVTHAKALGLAEGEDGGNG